MFRAYDARASASSPSNSSSSICRPSACISWSPSSSVSIAADCASGARGAARHRHRGVSAYLAQEYVAADSLDLVVREFGPAPPADALRVAAQLAGALDFAAVVNIAHGALHPRDVLLSSDETRLTGIGVAHALERSASPRRCAGRTGAGAHRRRRVGSPRRRVQPRRGDPRAALGPPAIGHRRTRRRGAHRDRAAPISTCSKPSFARALADDPSERFPTALEFAEALSKAFPGVTIAPARAAQSDRAAGAGRTRRRAVAAARHGSGTPAACLPHHCGAVVRAVVRAAGRVAACAACAAIRAAACAAACRTRSRAAAHCA